jgi:hypothetical protein
MMNAKKCPREAPMTPTHTAASDWPDWLQLVTTPGVSARQLRQLLSAYGGPAQVLAASEADRAHWVGAAAAATLMEAHHALRSVVDAFFREAQTHVELTVDRSTGKLFAMSIQSFACPDTECLFTTGKCRRFVNIKSVAERKLAQLDAAPSSVS